MVGSNETVKGASKKFFGLLGMLTPEEGAMMSLELAGCSKDAIDNGAFYVAPDMKQGDGSVIPLLADEKACDELYEGTMQWINSPDRKL